MQQASDTRSLGDLFAELTRETKSLIHQEVQLAKAEVTEKATRVGRDVGMIAAGGLVLYVGALVLVAALVLVLARFGLPDWAAAVIVGLAVVVGGYAMLHAGLTAFRRANLVPRHTIETIQETAADLAKGRTS